MIYKLFTRVIQYFCFPERPMKGGTSWTSRKGGGILEKGRGVDLVKGGWLTSLTKYVQPPPPPQIQFFAQVNPNYFGLKLLSPP